MGLLRHWWVAVKFVLTFAQLHLGIFVLSGALRPTVIHPDAAPVVPLIVGTALMAGALASPVWLSVAKPGGRTGLRRAKPPPAPVWLLVAGVVAPVADTAGGVVLGHPMPVVSLATLAVAAAWRLAVHPDSVGRGPRLAYGSASRGAATTESRSPAARHGS